MTDVTTLQGDWIGLLSFVSAVLLSTFILLFLLSSSVSLSNFYLAVSMRGCLGKHSCTSSPFPIAILNGTCSLRALILFCGDVPAIKTKLNNNLSIQFTKHGAKLPKNDKPLSRLLILCCTCSIYKIDIQDILPMAKLHYIHYIRLN